MTGVQTCALPIFADIFYNNCFKNGILPIALESEIVDQLFEQVAATEGYTLMIDLAAQTVTSPSAQKFSFTLDAFRKHCLLHGLDDIDLTLQRVDEIKSFEQKHRATSPWLFAD